MVMANGQYHLNYFSIHIDIFLIHMRIPNMEEVMDHTYHALDGSDGIELLKSVGLQIEEHPQWYYLNKKYRLAF